MGAKRNYEVVDSIRGVVSGQDDGFVLPLVFFGVAVATVLTDLYLITSVFINV